MGKNKKSIYILVFSNFLICLGIGLVIPVTPFIKNEYHFTTSQMGVMTSLFAFAQFIASPIVGKMSDKIGRKPLQRYELFQLAAEGLKITALGISALNYFARFYERTFSAKWKTGIVDSDMSEQSVKSTQRKQVRLAREVEKND